MATDTFIHVSPNAVEPDVVLPPILIGTAQITPTGGTQTSLASLINGGTVAQQITLATGSAIAAGATVTNSGTISGGTQAGTLTNAGTISGGTVAGAITNGGTITGGTLAPAVLTAGSFTVPSLANFGSITPTGSNVATAATIAAQVTQLGAAASTTGVVTPAPSSLLNLGLPILLVNNGTAAVHVYAPGTFTIDTIAGTTGVTLTNGFGCNIFADTATSLRTTQKGTIAS